MPSVTLFHSNDMHGRVEAMAKLSTYVKQERRQAEAVGRETLFWDAGDAADRRFEFVALSKGSTFPPLLAAMGVELQTLGNDIGLTYGPEAAFEMAAASPFPVLAANFRDGDAPLNPALSVTLASGIRLGVFGLTAPWGELYHSFGLHFPDTLPLAKRMVAELKAQGVDAVILLSHLGYELKDLPDVDDLKIAQEVPEIDLIIGAHTHTLLPEGVTVNGVLIAQTGDYAQRLGRIDLEFDARHHLTSKRASVLEVPADTPLDPAVLAAVSAAEQEAERLKSREVGELLVDLDLDYFDDCRLGRFAADALRTYMKADAALVMGGLFHSELHKGPVTLGDLNRACFTTANPCVTVLTGRELVDALERGLDPARYDHRHTALRGPPCGIPQLSGLRVWVDLARPVGRRVIRADIQGQRLDLEHVYRLAHTDAETLDPPGYLPLDPARTTQETPTILREALATYLQAHSPLALPEAERWHFSGGRLAGAQGTHQ